MILDLPLQADAAWAGIAVDIAKTAAKDSVLAMPRTENRLDINSFIDRGWGHQLSLTPPNVAHGASLYIPNEC